MKIGNPLRLTGKRFGSAFPLVKRVFDDIKSEIWLVIILQVVSLLAAPLALLTPLPLKIAIDQILGGKAVPDTLALLIPPPVRGSDNSLIAWTAGLVLFVALLSQAQLFSQTVLSAYTVQRLRVSLRARLFEHAQRLCLTYHDRVGISDSIYKINNDSNALGNLAAWGFTPLLSSSMILISIFTVMARLDGTLAGVALVIAPILLWLSYHFGNKSRSKWKRAQKVDHDSLFVVHEALSNLRIVKAFNQEQAFQQKFSQKSRRNIGERVRFAMHQGYFNALTGLSLALGTATVMYIGIAHVRSNVITLGTFVLIMGYLTQLYAPLKTLSTSLVSMQTSMAELERCYSLLRVIPSVQESPTAIWLGKASGDIVFANVSFAYNSSKPVLSDTSFHVPAGCSIGIFGETGAGKTTILGLASRFFDPSAGRVLLDGIDLRNIRLDDLRRQYSIVLQEPVLFNGTILENIAIGKQNASLDAIFWASEAAYAHEFIMSLPNGYETHVGERGMSLSGGQRQRVALARAFLKDAPILLLDEPTSAVDVLSEAQIMKGLQNLMKGRTTLMIAHRLKTLERCDYYLHVNSGCATMLKPDAIKSKFNGF